LQGKQAEYALLLGRANPLGHLGKTLDEQSEETLAFLAELLSGRPT